MEVLKEHVHSVNYKSSSSHKHEEKCQCQSQQRGMEMGIAGCLRLGISLSVVTAK